MRQALKVGFAVRVPVVGIVPEFTSTAQAPMSRKKARKKKDLCKAVRRSLVSCFGCGSAVTGDVNRLISVACGQ